MFVNLQFYPYRTIQSVLDTILRLTQPIIIYIKIKTKSFYICQQQTFGEIDPPLYMNNMTKRNPDHTLCYLVSYIHRIKQAAKPQSFISMFITIITCRFVLTFICSGPYPWSDQIQYPIKVFHDCVQSCPILFTIFFFFFFFMIRKQSASSRFNVYTKSKVWGMVS